MFKFARVDFYCLQPSIPTGKVQIHTKVLRKYAPLFSLELLSFEDVRWELSVKSVTAWRVHPEHEAVGDRCRDGPW